MTAGQGAPGAGPDDRVLLAIGDPNGIGPEIAAMAVRRIADAEDADAAGPVDTPVLVGDRSVLDPLLSAAGLVPRDFDRDTPADPRSADVIDTGRLAPGARRPGTVSAEAGAAAIGYVTTAVGLAREGGFRAVVACPHSETAVHAAGIEFSGYPPLVGQLTDTPPDRVFLMLVGGGLRIVHATLHEQLSGAVARLTPALVTAAGWALHDALVTLGTEHPRIGVFGINPHAGEGGLFGDDDERITVPALAALRERGVDAVGPAGADVLISTPGHDGFVAMYHDQGHIPVKLTAGRTASALTIGAGVPFSSVGHGTGFDIAGTGTADPTALLRTLRLFPRNRRTTGS